MSTESAYGVKASAWKMLDYANPAWAPVDYSGHGKNMQASFTKRPEENAIEYWDRIRRELAEKRLNEH